MESPEKFPPVPPPVRLAPLGCVRENEKPDYVMALRVLTPMGRDSSSKAQLSDVHRHFPSIGSQNGVEQLAGTRRGMSRGKIREAQGKPTAETWQLANRNKLVRIGVGGSWGLRGASVLEATIRKKPLHSEWSLTHV